MIFDWEIVLNLSYSFSYLTCTCIVALYIYLLCFDIYFIHYIKESVYEIWILQKSMKLSSLSFCLIISEHYYSDPPGWSQGRKIFLIFKFLIYFATVAKPNYYYKVMCRTDSILHCLDLNTMWSVLNLLFLLV